MRFLYKRPKVELVYEELTDVMDVMASDFFIFLDLLVFSLIFTLFLTPVFHSLSLSIFFFIGCYSLFSSFYYFVVKRWTIKRDQF